MIVRPFETAVEELTLRGTCYLPDAPVGAGAPAAALMHGLGGNRIEGARLFVSLAQALTAQGIAVLAWDRAGHGESDGSFFDTTVSRDVRHTHLVLDAFARLPEVDADDPAAICCTDMPSVDADCDLPAMVVRQTATQPDPGIDIMAVMRLEGKNGFLGPLASPEILVVVPKDLRGGIEVKPRNTFIRGDAVIEGGLPVPPVPSRVQCLGGIVASPWCAER